MSGRPDDARPTVRLTPAEQALFLRIVRLETHTAARRLLAWVAPADTHAGAGEALDAALANLWTNPAAGHPLDDTIGLGTINP